MPVQIDRVLKGSSAAKYGIRAGETLISVNGEEIRDFLDLQFQSSQQYLRLEILSQDGEHRTVDLERESRKALGIEPEPYQCRNCQNHCIFCFIDQMPPGLRDSLYVKDDDYIFSFVFGNYITLSNLSNEDFGRIRKQRISPLYVSAHTTNPQLRQKMMRYREEADLMARLRILAKTGIELHIQIVAVPGYNTGEELSLSLKELLSLGKGMLSIGVVPVGLTKYRDGLTTLQPFDNALALDTIKRIDAIRQELKTDLVYAADELYVLAEEKLPPAVYYNEYPQIENGIGMLRMLLSKFPYRKARFLKELKSKPMDYRMLCSRSAYSVIKGIAEALDQGLEDQLVEVQAIRNDFCGEHISVAGLLTFSDFQSQVKLSPREIPILPEAIFNSEGYTLDGATIQDFRELWQRDIMIVNQFFTDWGWE